MNYERYNNTEEDAKQRKASLKKYQNLDTKQTGYADNDGYKCLIELGEGAIAHIMLEWKANTDEQASRM